MLASISKDILQYFIYITFLHYNMVNIFRLPNYGQFIFNSNHLQIKIIFYNFNLKNIYLYKKSRYHFKLFVRQIIINTI